MPSVKKGESRNDYVGRCIPIVIKEGKTKDQAVGKCEGMYTQHVKEKNKRHRQLKKIKRRK